MGDADRVRENRLRRMAARQGLRLVKSPRRDRYADGYGTYRLVSAANGEPRSGDAVSGYGMDLDAVEQQLTSRPATTAKIRSAASSGPRRSGRPGGPGSAAETAGDASAALTVTVAHLDGQAEVVLTGELDFASAPQLSRALDQLIDEGHRRLRINISSLAFLDAAGIGALTGIRVRLADLGGQLSLVGTRGEARRALTACGLLEVFAPGQTAIHSDADRS
jgi:anti-anti-sigma factor